MNNSPQNKDTEELIETLSSIDLDLIGLSQDFGSHTPIPEYILLESTVDDDSIIIFSPPTIPDQQPNNVPPATPPPHSSTDTKSDDPPLLIDSSQKSGTSSSIPRDVFFRNDRRRSQRFHFQSSYHS